MKPVRKAVFPVAGLGTRFLPATKVMPKEMLPINDRPLIQHVFEEARAAGIEEFIFVTGRGKGALEDHFDIAYELEAVMTARGKPLDALSGTRFPAGSVVSVRQQEPRAEPGDRENGLANRIYHTPTFQLLIVTNPLLSVRRSVQRTRTRGGAA